MRPYTVIDCAQRTPEWYAARVGRLTGSCAADAIAFRKTDKKETADRAKLRLSLVAERLTGRALDDDAFVTKELQRGVELEEDAGIAYEAKTGLLVRWSGFLSHNALMVGCSLDGYVGEDITGIVEIKCPKSTTHLSYLLGTGLPEEYTAQVTHNLWVSEALWCDFVSFDDRFIDPKLRLFVHRVYSDEVDIAGYAEKAKAFLGEVDRDYQSVLTPAPTFAETLAKAAVR
jgi:hypothetical protein